MEIKKESDIKIDEDISIALMNLISIEEHAFFSYLKTKNKKYLQLIENTREIRKCLFREIIKNDGENWCISKHLLAASMRLMESGNKKLHSGKEKEAKEMYAQAAELYGMFWLLNIR